MTFKKLAELIEKYEVSEDVVLRSDSGWECDPTEIGGIWYNRENNEIILTQFPEAEDSTQNGFVLLE